MTAAALTAGSLAGVGPAPGALGAHASPSGAAATAGEASPNGGTASPSGLPVADPDVAVSTSSDGSAPATTRAGTPAPVDGNGDVIADPAIPGIEGPATTTVPGTPGISLPPVPIPPPASIPGTTTTTTVPAPTTATPTTHTFVANDDSATVLLSNSVVIDVVANDYDQLGHDIAIVSVSSPQLGTAMIIPSGKYGRIRYTSGALLGADTFTYTIRCSSGELATAMVHVTIIL